LGRGPPPAAPAGDRSAWDFSVFNFCRFAELIRGAHWMHAPMPCLTIQPEWESPFRMAK